MGQFQKVRNEDDDDEERNALVHDEDEVEAEYGQEHWQPRAGLFFGCLTLREALLLILVLTSFFCLSFVALSTAVNAVAKRSLVRIATSAFGTATTIGGVDFAIFRDTSAVWDLRVENPPAFSQEVTREGGPMPFMTLDEVRLGLRWESLLSDVWRLQEISLMGAALNIVQNPDWTSNAAVIASHLQLVSNWNPPWMQQAAMEAAPRRIDDDAQEASLDSQRRSLYAVDNKVMADRLTISGIDIFLCLRPICEATGPVKYTIRRVVVDDVGKKQGGVHLHELLDIIIQATLIAAVQAVPGQLGADLYRGLAGSLGRSLDFESVSGDLGSGLTKLRDWTSAELLRAEQALAGMASPHTVLSKDAASELKALNRNFSSALLNVGTMLEGAVEHAEEGLARREEKGRGAGERYIEGAKNANLAMQSALHSAEDLGETLGQEAAQLAAMARGKVMNKTNSAEGRPWGLSGAGADSNAAAAVAWQQATLASAEQKLKAAESRFEEALLHPKE